MKNQFSSEIKTMNSTSMYLAIESTQFIRTVFQFGAFPKQTMSTPSAKFARINQKRKLQKL
jgi:hypothetical protein